MAKATSTKTRLISLRFPVNELAEIEREAKETGSSVSSVVVSKTIGKDAGPDLGEVVYFLQAGDDGPVKIGWSKKLSSRVAGLQTGNSVRLMLIRTIPGEPWVKRWFHATFDEVRLVGEWFVYDPRMLTLLPPEDEPPMVATFSKTPAALDAALTDLGLAHAAFCEKAGVHRTTLARWLRGEVPIPAWVGWLCMTHKFNRHLRARLKGSRP